MRDPGRPPGRSDGRKTRPTWPRFKWAGRYALSCFRDNLTSALWALILHVQTQTSFFISNDVPCIYDKKEEDHGLCASGCSRVWCCVLDAYLVENELLSSVHIILSLLWSKTRQSKLMSESSTHLQKCSQGRVVDPDRSTIRLINPIISIDRQGQHQEPQDCRCKHAWTRTQ